MHPYEDKLSDYAGYETIARQYDDVTNKILYLVFTLSCLIELIK